MQIPLCCWVAQHTVITESTDAGQTKFHKFLDYHLLLYLYNQVASALLETDSMFENTKNIIKFTNLIQITNLSHLSLVKLILKVKVKMTNQAG